VSDSESPCAAPALPLQFVQHLAALERAYLSETDPIRQSGFAGGGERWYAERSPILEAITGSGEILDVGCANGYLLECLVQWGRARGISLSPSGLDCSAGLIELARRRQPQHAEAFYVGNAWRWIPPRRFAHVYSLWDCVPPEYFGSYVHHLLQAVVAPGGILIIGAYGSRSRAQRPAPVDCLLADLGLTVLGSASAGLPEAARFAWVRASSQA
jgi:SAM-dependent methyltransferase